MGLSKTEVNLRRLLATAPQQQNHLKLIHYVTTARELLEQLGAETTSEGISSISKAKLNEYSENIEALAAKLASPRPERVEVVDESSIYKIPSRTEQNNDFAYPSPGLRRRLLTRTETEDSSNGPAEKDPAALVKLDAAAQAHIEKHRKLQEDLTDEMVVLARQLKESSLMMNQSVQDTEKTDLRGKVGIQLRISCLLPIQMHENILDSTEKAVEHSLASTGRANTWAMEIYSQSSKTSCFTCLAMFTMICVFIMTVLLIRVT